MASIAKSVLLAVLLAGTLVTSFLVLIEFFVGHGQHCVTWCGMATFINFASAALWFTAWDVGFFMMIHVCFGTEAGGSLPTHSGVLIYCLCSHAFFWMTCTMIRNQEYIPRANNTVAALNATEKLQEDEDIKHLYLSAAMLAIASSFTISSLALCGLMFAPWRLLQSEQEIKATAVTKEKPNTEKPQNVQP